MAGVSDIAGKRGREREREKQWEGEERKEL
jgi:hypothetical protein